MIIAITHGSIMLKHKSKVLDRFREMKALVENSMGQKLKAIHTDNGGEYLSAEFQNYLKSEGVRHERTVPNTSQQNEVAELMNRTLVETVQSMLSDMQLSKKFSAKALSTAVYLRNRCFDTGCKGNDSISSICWREA